MTEPVTFGSRLRARWAEYPVLVFLVAAVDAYLVRAGHPNQPEEVALLLHAFLLWGALALPAVLLASLVGLLGPLLRGATSPRGIGGAMLTLFFVLLPIVGHQVLDRHTAMGGDVRALLRPRPWLELGGTVGLLALTLWVTARLTRGVPRRLLGTLAVLVSIVVGSTLLHDGALAPRDSVAEEAQGKPNVLLLVLDTTRAPSLSSYGYDRETTPALARLAGESLVFETARSVSIFTFTSHLSMLTGKYPGATGARMARMRVDPELAESVALRFNDAGYRTGAFVGTWVLAANSGIQRGFEVYDDRVDPALTLSYAWELVHDVQAVLAGKLGWFANNGQPHWFQDFQRPAAEVLEHTLAWIENGDPRPWFCMVNLYDAHWPYTPGRESSAQWVRAYDGPMDGYLFRSDRFPSGHQPDEADARHVEDLYDAEMWELDRRVDAFLGALDLERSNTAVVLTSDHGEAFGEGGHFEHKDLLEPQVRVPLLVRAAEPGRPVGVSAFSASGVDVAPTLLALGGLEIPAGLHGANLLAPDLPQEREVLIEDRDYGTPDESRLVLYSGRFKLVRTTKAGRSSISLFDLVTDPVGEVDLASQDPERAMRLDARLGKLRAPWADIDAGLELSGLGASADALSGLGYLGEGGDEADASP